MIFLRGCENDSETFSKITVMYDDIDLFHLHVRINFPNLCDFHWNLCLISTIFIWINERENYG